MQFPKKFKWIWKTHIKIALFFAPSLCLSFIPFDVSLVVHPIHVRFNAMQRGINMVTKYQTTWASKQIKSAQCTQTIEASAMPEQILTERTETKSSEWNLKVWWKERQQTRPN